MFVGRAVGVGAAVRVGVAPTVGAIVGIDVGVNVVVAVDLNGDVWVPCSTTHTVSKISGSTGEIIKTLCLEPLGLTVTQAAEGLGVSRKTLSAILNGRAGVSPEMAVRLSIAFGTSSESWLDQPTRMILSSTPHRLTVRTLDRKP